MWCIMCVMEASGDDTALGFRAALVRAREAVEEHVTRLDAVGLTWHETSVTDLLLERAWPAMMPVPFNQVQEGQVGADWLWWWIDQEGHAFGMLVQAKRLHADPWRIDYRYRSGSQMRALLNAAHTLQVPPVYCLYLGSVAFRSAFACDLHNGPNCERCHAATVSLLSGIIAAHLAVLPVASGIRKAIPLEDLGAPGRTSPLPPLGLTLAPDLEAFLKEDQRGAKAIAQHLLKQVIDVRIGQFSLDVGDVRVADNQVYRNLPDDRGHLYEPYFPNILRGLRKSPPSYVLEVMEGRPIAEAMPPSVAGIVILTL